MYAFWEIKAVAQYLFISSYFDIRNEATLYLGSISTSFVSKGNLKYLYFDLTQIETQKTYFLYMVKILII